MFKLIVSLGLAVIAKAAAIDYYCPASSIINNTCTILDKRLQLPGDLQLVGNLSIVLNNSTIVCTSNPYCNVLIRLTGTNNSLIMMNNSTIVAKQIVLVVPNQVALVNNSSLSVSGRSNSTFGTQTSNKGASMIGQGGSCLSASGLNYGSFNSIPTSITTTGNQIGSLGKLNDAQTLGGGRIVINCDNLNITGSITANAMPYFNAGQQYALIGGSGGYIYLNTTNIQANNTLGANFSIQANGGHGIFGGYGGAGGSIVFDSNFTLRDSQINSVSAGGGGSALTTENVNGCGNGAAGSIFFTNSQQLLIDNKGLQTTSYTVLQAPTPTIAKSFSVQGLAQAKIITTASLSLTNLTTTANSTIQIVSIQPLTVNISSNISTLIDLSLTQNVTINVPTAAMLGPLTYNSSLTIVGGDVTLQGELKQAIPSATSLLMIDVSNLVIQSKISAAYLVVSGRQSIKTQKGFVATSYIVKTCNTSPTAHLFQCLPQSRILTNYTFVQSYNSKFNQFLANYADVLKLVASNYTTYFVSFGSIQMSESQVNASRVGFCSQNITLTNTVVDTSGLGCQSDQGLGRGNLTTGCSASGASFGGLGGNGAPINDNYTATCLSAVSKTYFAADEARFEGSGGGSANASQKLGGSGGGIIWISANTTLNMTNSILKANGLNATNFVNATIGSGGGSGGSIALNAMNAYGNVDINLSGGNGSIGGGGGGAGGQLNTYFASNATSIVANVNLNGGFGGLVTLKTSNSTNATVISNTTNGTNVTNVTKRLRIASTGAGNGQQGVASVLNCSAGYSGSFCSACAIGEFKLDNSSIPCSLCQNKPANSVYISTAQTTQQCNYECTSGIEPAATNSQCLTAMATNIDIVGGMKGVYIIIGCLGFIILVIWTFILLQAYCQASRRQKEFENILTQLETPTATNNQTKVDDTINSQNQRLSLKDNQIWGHEHRMYLIGDGSIVHPWRIPKDFPTNALHQATLNRFLDFAKQNKVMEWSAGSKCCYGLTRILFPYMADWQHRNLRQSQFNSLTQSLYQSFEVDFWIDSYIRTIRLTADIADTQLAYIDFIDQRRNIKYDYVAPKLPQVFLLAGNGTFSTPFRADFQNDILMKSLIFLNKTHLQKLLPLFFQQLNTLLEKVNFHKFHFQIKQDLLQIIELVEDCNINVFNQIQTSIQFYMFESKTSTGEGGVVKQRNRNMPLDNKLIKDTVLMDQLIKFIQNKTYNRKSEVRFGLVIKSTVVAQEMSLSERMSKGFQVITRPNHEKDKDGVIAKMQQLDKSKMSLLQQVLLPESKQLDSEVCIYGQKSQTVRINDKSVRAFGLKEDQNHALIIKLRKNATNYGVGFRSFFYGFWIMLFKRQGRPSGLCCGPIWSFFFAVFVAIDLLLATVFLCHIGFSHQNKLWITYGIPFLAVNPGLVVIAPLWCFLGSMFGSTRMLKTYSTMNLCMLLFNYPATLAIMIWKKEQLFYEMLMVALIVNKVFLSMFGAKVRSYLLNPFYNKNKLSLKKEFDEFKKQMKEYYSKLSASQRQQKLIDQSIKQQVKAEQTFEFQVEHEVKQYVEPNPIVARVIKPPVKTQTFAQQESPLKTTIQSNSGYISVDQFSDNRHYPAVKYPAVVPEHESHSSLLTNEENITMQASDSGDEVFGIIATSRLRPSSVPTESAQKQAYEGYYY